MNEKPESDEFEEEDAEEVGGSVARVPADPETGSDVVLRVGYRTLRATEAASR